MANGNGQDTSGDLQYQWPQQQGTTVLGIPVPAPTSRLPVMSPDFVFGTSTAPAGAGQPGFDPSSAVRDENRKDLARTNMRIWQNLPSNALRAIATGGGAMDGSTTVPGTLVPGGAVASRNPLVEPVAPHTMSTEPSTLISPYSTGGTGYDPVKPIAPPPGRVTPGPPGSDPDAGAMVAGTNIPVSIAKQYIRAYEPGPEGYNAAWGMKGGLPSNVPVDEYGFPTKQAYPGAPVGSTLYGGKYAGQNSSAYGMYQFERSTWQGYAKEMKAAGIDITDNSPASQEKMASWVLQHHGFGDWLPYNANLRAAIGQYNTTGQVADNLYSPAGYTGPSGSGGPMYAGDPVGGGMGMGGALAFAPPRPVMTGPNAPVQPEGGNVNQAGGPGGETDPRISAIEQAFGNKIGQNQQMGRGYQMLALLGLLNQGRKVTPVSGYNPANADPTIRRGDMPMAARVEGGYAMGRVPGQLWY